MAEWRLGRGWRNDELTKRLERLRNLPVNFEADQDAMTPARGWNHYRSAAVIGHEPPGQPLEQGPFQRAEIAVANYQFSDPEVVIGHFDSGSRLLGRRMLLEMKAVVVLHYLAGVVVGAVRNEEQNGRHTFAFRYDTLQGHIERGSEWFVLTKDLHSGEIRFEIEAAWLPGDFPNWWSRLGFKLLAPRYQRHWHREAHRRLFRIARGAHSEANAPDEHGLAHAGPDVIFERTPRHTIERDTQWDEEETIRSS
jgi:uncharacterized protein (UPF0548 family)